MTDPIDAFFGPARRFALGDKERMGTWKSLQEYVRAAPENRLQQSMEQHETLLGGMRSVGLSVQEKEAGLSALRAHMASNPPRVRGDAWAWLRTLSSAVAGLATATAAFGGIALAAEGAMPGDALYAVKVAVNDSVTAAYLRGTRGEEASIEWLLARRIGEVEALAERGEREVAVTHFAAQQYLVETVALNRPDAPVLARQLAAGQRLDSTVAIAAATAQSANDTVATGLANAPSPSLAIMEEQLPQRAKHTEDEPTATQPMALMAAQPDQEIPQDLDAAPLALEAAGTLAADEPPAVPMAMMARKALLPVAGSGSTGSGASTSGVLLPAIPAR